MKLTTKILLGLVIGATVGIVVQASGSAGARSFVLTFEPLGTAFIRLISMVVVPLVVASLFVGTCSVGDIRRLGRIGTRSLALFLVTTLTASFIGLCLGVLAQPGASLSPEVRDRLFQPFVTTKPSEVGAGLGLEICRMIVEQTGGTITALENPAGGAVFSVTLPAEEPS